MDSGAQMKKAPLLGCAIGLLIVWTALVVAGTVFWMRREGPELALTRAHPIEVSVGDWVRLGSEPWMLSTWRMTRGKTCNVKRENLSEGGIRIVVDDANGFSWDTVTLDLTKAQDGSIRGTAKVDWTRDMGPPFTGSWGGVTGEVWLNSSDLVGAHPLLIEFTLREMGEDNPGCEHGVVSVP